MPYISLLHVIHRHYSYVPPSTPQFHPTQLTHTQAAPRSFQQTRANQEQRHLVQAPLAPTPQGQRITPISAKFRPAKMSSASNNKPSPSGTNNQGPIHRHSGQQQGSMGPPPTPLHVRQKQSENTAMHINHPNPNMASSSTESLQVHPGNTHPRTNRFGAPDHQPLQSQTMPPNTRAPSRVAPFNTPGGNQRMPFVPGAR